MGGLSQWADAVFGGSEGGGGLLISAYAGLSFFVLFASQGLTAQAARALVVRFNQTFPQQVGGYEWAYSSSYSTTTGILFGAIGGLAIFVVASIVICSGVSGNKPTEWIVSILVNRLGFGRIREEKQQFRDVVTGLAVIFFYMLTYAATSVATNTFLLGTIDMLYALIYALISGAATFLLIYFKFRRKRRREYVRDKEIQLRIFETEATWLRQLDLVLITGLVGIVASAVFNPSYSSLGSTPQLITSTQEYRNLLLGIGSIFLAMILGFFSGIWLQVFWQGADISEALREYGGSFN